MHYSGDRDRRDQQMRLDRAEVRREAKRQMASASASSRPVAAAARPRGDQRRLAESHQLSDADRREQRLTDRVVTPAMEREGAVADEQDFVLMAAKQLAAMTRGNRDAVRGVTTRLDGARPIYRDRLDAEESGAGQELPDHLINARLIDTMGEAVDDEVELAHQGKDFGSWLESAATHWGGTVEDVERGLRQLPADERAETDKALQGMYSLWLAGHDHDLADELYRQYVDEREDGETLDQYLASIEEEGPEADPEPAGFHRQGAGGHPESPEADPEPAGFHRQGAGGHPESPADAADPQALAGDGAGE